MISLPILIGAAIVDSINPCAIGVLVFLLAYLSKHFKKPSKMILHGLTYIFAVFVTYLVAGLLLLPIISGFGKMSVNVYAGLGALVIIAGLLELKDFFWYGKGPSLALFPGAAERIKIYTNKISESLAGTFALGVFVALVELPCTGAVYLAVLSLLTLSGGSISSLTTLLLYNFIFVLPLIIVLFVIAYGADAAVVEEWRKKHRKLMRAVIGLTLVALGGWMVWYALF